MDDFADVVPPELREREAQLRRQAATRRREGSGGRL